MTTKDDELFTAMHNSTSSDEGRAFEIDRIVYNDPLAFYMNRAYQQAGYDELKKYQLMFIAMATEARTLREKLLRVQERSIVPIEFPEKADPANYRQG